MAKFRQIHVTMWTDPFIEDLDTEQKLFYIYLLTNNRTKQCGIYEITKKTIANELGYDLNKVAELLEFFVNNKKILYCEETKEIILVNWIKYNWIDSKPVKNCIYKELQSVKNKEFINLYDTLLIPYGYRINTLIIDKKDGIKEENVSDTVSNNETYPMHTVPIPYADTIQGLGGRIEKEEEKEEKRKEIYSADTDKNISEKSDDVLSGWRHPNLYNGKELTKVYYDAVSNIPIYAGGFERVDKDGD